jgi:hypothetical protein
MTTVARAIILGTPAPKMVGGIGLAKSTKNS